MPPWGVPSVGSSNSCLSRIPDFSHALICLLILGKVLTFSSNLVWFMRSKHLLMSASNMYLGLCLIALKILCIASWQFLPGRKPKLFGSKRASHSGSNAALTKAWIALSCITGIPRGRCLPFDLGIHTLRTGLDLSFNLRIWTSLRRCFGVNDLIPSTPAVFLPALSWDTRLTANSLA